MTQLTIDVNNRDHISGSLIAPIVLVEYGDYECPYCGLAYPIVKNIQRKLGDGMRFVFRNFPLSKIHPHAFRAAVATEAAALQQKFWEMHDIVFENQKKLDNGDIVVLAQNIGLDPERFKQDIQRIDLAEKVEQDFEKGIRLGVNRTPTFFVNEKKYDGGLEEGQLFQFLKDQLKIASTSRG
jgi:protein-disulfide isomerase